MKNLLFIFLLCFCSLSLCGQSAYWNCSNIKVDDSERLVKAFDQYFATDLAQNMPTVVLSQIVNRNTTLQATHQLCLLTTDPSDFDNMSSNFANAEAQVLGMIWDDEVEVVSTVMGTPLIFNPNNLGNGYSNIFSLDVESPQTVASAFGELATAMSGVTLELHAAISGAENHVTHYIVARAENLAKYLENRNKVISSDAFATYMEKAGGSYELINVFATRLLKTYNGPE